MFLKWLRSLTSAPSRRQHRRSATCPARARFQPKLEALEDRQLLSGMAPVAASAALSNTVYYERDGGLYQDKSGTEALVAAGNYKQVSCGLYLKQGAFFPTDAIFALDGSGHVSQYIPAGAGTFQGGGTLLTNVAEISASQVALDTFFLRGTNGAVYEFSHQNLSALGAPLGIDPNSATQISAGKDGATGKEAVFVNFSGALYEHTGSSPNLGWSFVSGVYKPANLFQSLFAVSDFSGSQVQGDTVFVITPGVFLGGQLGEHVGTDPNSGWTSITTQVSQVSAGVDSLGHPAAFYSTGNALYEHASFGPDVQIAANTSVSYLAASQTQSDTVYYGGPKILYSHAGSTDRLVWVELF
jgi:hypothetical protein